MARNKYSLVTCSPLCPDCREYSLSLPTLPPDLVLTFTLCSTDINPWQFSLRCSNHNNLPEATCYPSPTPAFTFAGALPDSKFFVGLLFMVLGLKVSLRHIYH